MVFLGPSKDSSKPHRLQTGPKIGKNPSVLGIPYLYVDIEERDLFTSVGITKGLLTSRKHLRAPGRNAGL